MKFGKSLSRRLKRSREQNLEHSIFVVDDEQYILDTLKDLLESHQYQVEVCNSGELAIERLKERELQGKPFKVVISDQRMPGLRGVDVLTECKRMFPQTRRVLYTAYTDVDAIIDSINRAQVYRFLRKQGEDEDLLLTLKTAVGSFDLETEHKQLLADLENRVRQRTEELHQKTEELARKNSQLEQLNYGKDRLFSILSHDLRGPFQNFLFAFEEFSDLDGFTIDEVEALSLQMHQMASNLYTMVDNLLSWSQLQFDSLRPEAVMFSPYNVVKEILDTNRGISKNKSVSMSNRIPAALRWYTDPGMVMIIIHNLVSNALKYCNEGDLIEVECSVEEEGILELKVRDSGIGIPPTTLPDLFNEHVRPVRSGTKQEKGMGLGLTICSELVGLLGGAISVQSKVDKGSVFTVQIPEYGKVRKPSYATSETETFEV